jgi:frataxin-like iron-binding protein CyaY
VLTISTIEGRVLTVRLTNGVQTLTPKKQGVLIFNRYGNKHFLSQVWIAGSNMGRVFRQSRSERELEREVKSIARLSGEKVPATMTVSVVVAGPR